MKTLRLLKWSSLRAAAVLFFLVASAAGSRAQNCHAFFMYSVDTTVSPNVLSLWDSSWAGAGAITNYQWSYNGSPVGTNAPNQTLNINVAPFDFICLTITTDSGCVSTWCDTVWASTPPCQMTVSYSFSHDSLGNYTFVPVVNGSTAPVTYSWWDSNGGSSSLATYITNFNTVGTFIVCLTVVDANSCQATFCDSIAVTGGSGCQGCVPHLYYTIDSLNPHLYTFYDSTTYLNTPTTSSWTVNSVNAGSGSSITVNLPNPGTTYQVCHNVNVSGCPGTCPHSACLWVITPHPPGVNINYFDTDSSTILCTAPSVVNMYLYGNITGYPQNAPYHVYINFDDGTDSSFTDSSLQNYFYVYFTHIYSNAGSYTPQVIVYSADSLFSDTMVMSHPINITGACAPLSGYVYLDHNSNCVFDSGDVPLNHRSVYLTNGTSIYRYTYTDANGFYSFNVPTGQTYTVHVNTVGNWYSGNYSVLCPAGGTHTVSSLPSSNNNFFLVCPSAFDLSVSISGWGFVPGNTGSVCVYPSGLGCTTPSGQIQVILDPLLTAVPDSDYTINGDTVTWTITGTGSSSNYYQSRCIHVVTSTSATIGDSVCITATITPIVGDSVPSNNVQTRCWAVRTSWDPNDKNAEPAGAGANHAIRPEQELTYTIRFQNTGTAPAQNIYILDPLDANLDLNTFQVLATSHPVETAVLSGRVLRFTYDNINLLDSNANEPLSHGYVTYRISPVANVANGTVINNTASIYFDYNPAVVTNTTMHSIDIFLSVHQPKLQNDLVSVYPNPASDRLFVELKKTGRAEVKLYDATGRLVLHSTLQASGMVDVHGLQAGSYTIQVMQNDAVQNANLILVK